MVAFCPVPVTNLDFAPSIVSDQNILIFYFYFDQLVQEGMTYKNELYRLKKRFRNTQRLDAYQLGCELVEQYVPTIISVSRHHYSVWISLRNPLAADFAS